MAYIIHVYILTLPQQHCCTTTTINTTIILDRGRKYHYSIIPSYTTSILIVLLYIDWLILMSVFILATFLLLSIANHVPAAAVSPFWRAALYIYMVYPAHAFLAPHFTSHSPYRFWPFYICIVLCFLLILLILSSPLPLICELYSAFISLDASCRISYCCSYL